jgi:Glycosyltransferase (GlcNAc)
MYIFMEATMSMHNDQIFVQIPAYRDPQLFPTLESLFAQARNPDRLRVRVCWQRAVNDLVPHHSKILMRSIEVDEVEHDVSHGANWARRRVQKFWQSEPYSLIIDSHLRFQKNWDAMLIDMLLQLKSKGVKKPLITCYPPNFNPKTFPKSRSLVPLKNYSEAYIDNLLLHFAGHRLPLWRWLNSPVPAQFLALGLLFTEGKFNAEIPLDPNIYFFGDEITTGLRAYCHGYDFFHPHRVVAWHAYDRLTRRCHWEDHADWSITDIKSLKRARRVMQGHSFKGYELGSMRSIKSYENYIGMPLIRFKSK